MWLNENVCVVFVYRGETEIYIRNRDQGVMLTKTHWENLVRLTGNYAKTLGFDRYFGI